MMDLIRRLPSIRGVLAWHAAEIEMIGAIGDVSMSASG